MASDKGLRCTTCRRVVPWKYIDIVHGMKDGQYARESYCNICNSLLKTEYKDG